MSLKALNYILHFVFVHYVCTFGLSNFFLKILLATFYIVFVQFMFCIYVSSLQITFYILHFVFLHYVCTFCLCTFYLFLILLVAFYIVSMHVYVCAHCVYSFCFKLYKIFAIFILSFGCYLCVEAIIGALEFFTFSPKNSYIIKLQFFSSNLNPLN
jgi:hypothetical protein